LHYIFELMSQKKISGYVIFLKEVLGKGSYGSVTNWKRRYTEESRTGASCSALSKCLRRV
jgi:hypothetical protein